MRRDGDEDRDTNSLETTLVVPLLNSLKEKREENNDDEQTG